MHIEGEHRFDAARQATWDALLDPRSLQSALPGCEAFRETAPGQFEVTLRVGIAAIKGTYTGVVVVNDRQPLDKYTLLIKGLGKAGRVSGTTVFSLREDGPRTVVSYVADMAAEGALARLGGRVLTGAAKLLAAQFFRSMEDEVANRVA